MNRRMTLIVPLMAIAAAGYGRSHDKPNIVFILADDLGYGDTGCYGQTHFDTPNIDSLASNGARFTRFYSGTTVSAPSRACLLTGLHSGNAPVRGNIEVYPEGQYPLPQGTPNIFRMLSEAGYSTAAMGKWGLGAPGSEGDPINQGVGHFFGYNCQRMAHNYYPDHLWNDTVRIELPQNAGGGFGAYAQDMIHEEALRYIREHRDGPFFLYLPYVLPHAELIVPEDSVIMNLRGLYPENPFRGCDSGPAFRKGGYCSQDEPRATFAAMVTRLDSYVGEIVALLKELDIYDNTVIIFTSDNGPHAEGGADPVFFDSNGNLRGMKRDLYEGGIRVPFIMCMEGIGKGTVNDGAFAFWDILPTMAELAGADTSGYSSDGISILPFILDGGKTSPVKNRTLYFEFHEDGGKQAVIRGRWKLIRLDAGTDKCSYELYDLKNDPGETEDLLENPTSRSRRIAHRLAVMMDGMHTNHPDWPLRKQL